MHPTPAAHDPSDAEERTGMHWMRFASCLHLIFFPNATFSARARVLSPRDLPHGPVPWQQEASWPPIHPRGSRKVQHNSLEGGGDGGGVCICHGRASIYQAP
jgi:hypothetical protein